MERKNKACWNCWHYKAYYTKELIHFEKQNAGFCRKSNEQVDKHGLCPLWYNDLKRKETRKKASIRKLNEVLNSLIEIKQILFELKETDE